MSTSDAAEYLGVTLRTVYRFIDDGHLPAYKFGRVIRVKEDEVVAFVEASRITPGSLEHLHPEPVPAKPTSARDKLGGPSGRNLPGIQGGQARGVNRPSVPPSNSPSSPPSNSPSSPPGPARRTTP
ncbi:MAG TPA: helix-turn-helix domain-containing protein [Acidimicrobiales bacterium]|nr:helix-turn-helix domain-containing protein [Acidimicrobiales bacterium]